MPFYAHVKRQIGFCQGFSAIQQGAAQAAPCFTMLNQNFNG